MRSIIVVVATAMLLALPALCFGEPDTRTRASLQYQLTEGDHEFVCAPAVEARSFYLSSNGVPLYSGLVGQGKILLYYDGFYFEQISSRAVRFLSNNYNDREDVLKKKESSYAFGKILDAWKTRWNLDVSYVDMRPLSKASGMDALTLSTEASWYDSDIYYTDEGVAGHLYLGANRRFAADREFDSWQAKTGVQGESWTEWIVMSGAGELMYDSGSFGAKPAFVAKLGADLGPRMWNAWLRLSTEVLFVYAPSGISANKTPRYIGREKARILLGIAIVPFMSPE